MRIEDFGGLEIARYRLRLRAVEHASLPMFLGSTLRGAFGHALKQAVCVMSHKACERCLVHDRCLYPYLFETPAPPDAPLLKGQNQAPHPFILTPPFLNLGPHASSVPGGNHDLAVPLGAHPSRVPEFHPAPLGPYASSVPNANRDPSDYPRALSDGQPESESFAARASASAPRPTVPGAVATGSLSTGPLSMRPTVESSPYRELLAQPDSQPVGLAATSRSALLPGSPRLVKRPLTPVREDGELSSTARVLSTRTFLRQGESLSFDLVLIGRAIEYMPYVVFAVTEMAHRGLGVGRNRFELDDVTMIGASGSERSIYSGKTQKIATPENSRASLSDLIRARLSESNQLEIPEPQLASASGALTHANGAKPSLTSNPDRNPLSCSFSDSKFAIQNSQFSSLRISFLTPTRIKIDGEPQSAPSFDLLVRSLLRRISMIFSVHSQSEFRVD
ncbi:MAG: hypothetical protein ACREAC_03490, partial [Blastocatellia bacterium]